MNLKFEATLISLTEEQFKSSDGADRTWYKSVLVTEKGAFTVSVDKTIFEKMMNLGAEKYQDKKVSGTLELSRYEGQVKIKLIALEVK